MSTRKIMSYSIEEHKHRFAAWAAGRAATVNGCRFKVEDGKKILERLDEDQPISLPHEHYV